MNKFKKINHILSALCKSLMYVVCGIVLSKSSFTEYFFLNQNVKMLLYFSFQIFSNFLLSHIGGRKIFSDSGELVRTASRNTLLQKFVFGVTFTLVYYRMWLGGLRKKEEKRLY